MRWPLAELHAQVEDVAGLLVDHRLGQAEARDLRADEAARLGFAVEHGDLVAQRRQVARHGQRGRPGADAGHALAVARRHRRHARTHVALVVGGDALEPADRHRFGLLAVVLLHASAPAGRLAGPVAGAAQHAREDVGHPVDHVGVAVATLADQADVLRYRGVGRAGPLAIDDLVEVGRIRAVGELHCGLLGRCLRADEGAGEISLITCQGWVSRGERAIVRSSVLHQASAAASPHRGAAGTRMTCVNCVAVALRRMNSLWLQEHP